MATNVTPKQPSPDPTNGCVKRPNPPPVAWYPFDEAYDNGSGQFETVDLTQTVSPAAVHGGATFGPGYVSNAVGLNGSDAYLEVPNHPKLNFGKNANISFDFWIRTKQQPGTRVILDKRVQSASNWTGYHVYLSSGKIGLQIASGSYKNVTSPLFVGDGKWHFVAITLETMAGGLLKWYLDSQSPVVVTGAQAGSMTNAAPLRIGRRSVGPSGFFKGEIDELEIFDRILLPTEVSELHQAGPSGKCK